jgi:sulfopyruvate decarboxylase subunit alpha
LGSQFLDLLERHGYDFFTGVPCSLFEGVTCLLDDDPRYGYVSAVREDAALGLAAGAYLGGRQPVVLMQNSGLGVSINAIVSLHQIYDIPALLLVSWRGQDGRDAPEHLIMGRVTVPFLELLEIPFEVFDRVGIEEQIRSLTDTMRKTRRPVALVVPKGLLDR